MSSAKKLFWISLCLVLFSCKKKVPLLDYPEEHYCEKFVGKYEMYDPTNQMTYDMVISCIINEQEYYDTIVFFNYANRFDFKYRLGVVGYPHDSKLDGKIINPLLDHSGNSTAFSSVPSSFSPPKNILRNDSLFIVFTINNLAYYIEDGVPWEVCDDCLHYGVKVH